MRIRAAIIATPAVITMMAVAGCTGDGQKGPSAAASPSPDGKGAGPSVSPGPKEHTAKDLEKALIVPPSGATNALSQSGAYEKFEQGRSTRTWTVSFYGPGYRGNVGMTADGTTRAEVPSQARLAYQKAGATLG